MIKSGRERYLSVFGEDRRLQSTTFDVSIHRSHVLHTSHILRHDYASMHMLQTSCIFHNSFPLLTPHTSVHNTKWRCLLRNSFRRPATTVGSSWSVKSTSSPIRHYECHSMISCGLYHTGTDAKISYIQASFMTAAISQFIEMRIASDKYHLEIACRAHQSPFCCLRYERVPRRWELLSSEGESKTVLCR